jgi:hypothetical protein
MNSINFLRIDCGLVVALASPQRGRGQPWRAMRMSAYRARIFGGSNDRVWAVC